MYDLNEIKAIPCQDIASKFGINLNKKHNKLWGKMREEKTASFCISPDKNIWYDFGMSKGGTVIDLVIELQGCNSTDAINWLAKEYGFESEKTKGWRALTDNQYRELGIYPERATLNFNIDLTKHRIEQVQRWNNKYGGITIVNLAKEYPSVYNKMITTIALRNINELREIYKSHLNNFLNPDTNEKTKLFIKNEIETMKDEINRKVDLLERAIISKNSRNYSYLKVDGEKDLITIKKKLEKNVLVNNDFMKNKISNAYIKLFNYDKIKYFSNEQIKALYDINKTLSKSDNKYINIDKIKELHKKIGNNIDVLQGRYTSLMKEGDNYIRGSDDYKKWLQKADSIKNQINGIKNLFEKCNVIFEGIKQANLLKKSETIKSQEYMKTEEIER